MIVPFSQDQLSWDIKLDQRKSQFVLALKRLGKNKAALFGAFALALLVSVAALAPYIAPYDPGRMFYGQELEPPFTNGSVLGTNSFGRDIFSYVVYGLKRPCTLVRYIVN